MTQQPLPAIQSVVARYAEAWAGGDLSCMIACYHDDLTFHYLGQNPLAGTHSGKSACLGVLKAFAGKTNRRLIAIEDVLIQRLVDAMLS